MGLNVLPEDCVSKILSFTSPADVGRLSLVSKPFNHAAEADAVWGSFLPPECDNGVISLRRRYSSKKELYLSLCDHPVLIDDGKKSLSLEKRTGRKCFMLSARDLVITWSNNLRYWKWIRDPESRFEEVAELISVCWLEIKGNIRSNILSEDTLYGAYLVFKLTEDTYGLESTAEAAIVRNGREGHRVHEEAVCLDADGREQMWSLDTEDEDECRMPEVRADGWLEIELGEFFNKGDEEDELEMSLKEVEHLNWKTGLIVQGIEVRPKSG